MHMSDTMYTDRDILIEVRTLLAQSIKRHDEFRTEVKTEFHEIWQAIDELKTSSHRGSGFFDATKMLVGALGAAAGAVGGLFAGKAS